MTGAGKAAAFILGGLAIAAVSLKPADAAVISTVTNAGLSSTPFVASFNGGVATLSFTSATTLDLPGAAVSTGGSAQVTTIFGGIADFQAGTTFNSPPDPTVSYAAFTVPTVVQYSAADDFIGFSYIGSDGIHYGYAELFGPTLTGYAYESTPNTAITATALNASPVPEPASIALLLSGIGAVGLVRRRKQGAAHA